MPSDPQGGHLAAGRRGSERARTNVARSWRSRAPQPPAALLHAEAWSAARRLDASSPCAQAGSGATATGSGSSGSTPTRPPRAWRLSGSIRHPGRSRVRPPAPRPLGPAGGSVPPGSVDHGRSRPRRDRRLEEMLGCRPFRRRGPRARPRVGGARGRLRGCARDRCRRPSGRAPGRRPHRRGPGLGHRRRLSREQPRAPRHDRPERRDRASTRPASRPVPGTLRRGTGSWSPSREHWWS